MTTTADLIAATQRHLFSGAAEETNWLAANTLAGDATLTIVNPAGGIQAGARIAIGLEVFKVKSVVGTTVTVAPAQEGSAAAAHTAGDAVVVDPKFSPWTILGALNSELMSLSASGLYQMLTKDVTFDSSILGYDLGTNVFLDVYEIQWKATGSRKAWPTITDYDVDRNMDTAVFPSGTALFITGATTGQEVHIRYKAGFTALAALADDVLAVSGLPITAHDIPPLGAAWRLVAASEVRRNFISSQGDSKRLTEVPPGAQRQAAGGLQQLRDARVREEADRLRKAYPSRRTW